MTRRRKQQPNPDDSFSTNIEINRGNNNNNTNIVHIGYLPQTTTHNHVFSNFNIQHQPIRYPLPQFYRPNFPQPNHGPIESKRRRQELPIDRINKAVMQTRKLIVAARESVCSTRVSRSVLEQFESESWLSLLGLQMQDVTSLLQLITLEGKINAFIHCFVNARKIVTLHDLHVALCKSECVDSFDDLELGPLLKHSLVLQYFPSFSGGRVEKVTNEDIVSLLDTYLDMEDRDDDVKVDEFLDFVALKKSVTSKDCLGVRIQSLRMYVSFIQDAKRQEAETLKSLHDKYQIPTAKKGKKPVDDYIITNENGGELHTGGTPLAIQAQQTGRKGEEIAYKYFVGKCGNEARVRWVNGESETGLPYDLVIEYRGGKKEYVEVKATVSNQKEYFNLTVREWEFAIEKGDDYIIAHFLLGNRNAILRPLRNPVKLCHQGDLRLNIHMINHCNEVHIAF